jgi:heptose I phosphotransferase
MDLAVTDRFHAKQGRSSGRCIVASGERLLAFYLKRHHRLPWWRGWLALLRPQTGWSPAAQEWRHLHWARAQGFPVPNAVAVGENIGPWGTLRSFLAVEELTGMLPLHEAIPLARKKLDPRTFRQWKRALTGEMARLARALHGRRVFHKDFYLCHFYVPEELTGQLAQWRGQVHLIDLHRLAHHPLAWPIYQLKDLAQLLYSSQTPGVTVRDQLEFWRCYLGSKHETIANRLLRLAIKLKWRRYRRHNLKRMWV